MSWKDTLRAIRALIFRVQSLLLSEPFACLLFLLFGVTPIALFVFFLHRLVARLPAPTNVPIPLFTHISCYSLTFNLALVASAIALVLSGFQSKFFWRNFSKWVRQIIRPLSLGAALAYFILSFYFYLVDQTNPGAINYDSVMATALGIYLSTCALFVGFHGIFFEKMPILDIEMLMELISQDIEDCCNRIFWSFPGLSFGSVTVGGKLYDRFHSALIDKIKSAYCKTTVLVLTKEEITKFYKPYFKDAEAHADPIEKKMAEDAAQKAVDHSHTLIDIAMQAQKPFMHLGGCDVRFVDPDFRHQTIIIDNNIYFLHSIGLPRRVNGEWAFTSEKRVNFITTRISNGALASQLCDLIRDEEKAVRNRMVQAS